MSLSNCVDEAVIIPPNQDKWTASKKFVTTRDGIQLAYVEWGKIGHNPVILIHGYTDSSRAWSLIAPYLNDRHFIAVDLRGHGNSEKTKDGFNLTSFAKDMCELLDALGIEKADFIGHSLGSMTSAAFAIYHANRVNRVILVSTAVQPPGPMTDWLAQSIASATFPLDADGKFLEEWSWNPHPVDPVFLKHLRREEAATPYETWKGCLDALEITNWAQAARHIKSPTFVLWGDQDQLFGETEQQAVMAALPKAKFKTYKGYGHSMTWEIPDIVAGDIMMFLDGSN